MPIHHTYMKNIEDLVLKLEIDQKVLSKGKSDDQVTDGIVFEMLQYSIDLAQELMTVQRVRRLERQRQQPQEDNQR